MSPQVGRIEAVARHWAIDVPKGACSAQWKPVFARSKAPDERPSAVALPRRNADRRWPVAVAVGSPRLAGSDRRGDALGAGGARQPGAVLGAGIAVARIPDQQRRGVGADASGRSAAARA